MKGELQRHGAVLRRRVREEMMEGRGRRRGREEESLPVEGWPSPMARGDRCGGVLRSAWASGLVLRWTGEGEVEWGKVDASGGRRRKGAARAGLL